jgi:glutamine synthetase
MLPKDLETALRALEKDTELTEFVGKEVVERYIAVKRAELEFLDGMSASDRRIWIMERY